METKTKNAHDIISTLLDNTVLAYIEKVSKVHSLDNKELLELWDSTISGFEICKKSEAAPKKTKTVSNADKCKGTTKAGTECKLKAKKGGFCTRHSEDADEKPKGKKKAAKKDSDSDDD